MYRNLSRRRWGVAALVLVLASVLSAQDSHYWSQPFGTRSNLLGGVVIGSVNDLAATYYNPGRLTQIEESAFLLSARVYQFTNLNVKNGLGRGQDVSQSRLSTVPGFTAGVFSARILGSDKVGYSILARHRAQAQFVIRRGDSVDVVVSEPGPEFLGQEARLAGELKDDWYGVSWARNLTREISLGVSTFLSFRRQSGEARVLLESLSASNRVATAVRINEYNYKTLALLWKIGVSAQFSTASLGLVITTPRLHLMGSSSVLFNDVVSHADLDGDGQPDDLLVAVYEPDLDARYKSPWAVGAGAGLTFGRTTVHLSAEWFGPVDKYIVANTETFVGQSTGDTLQKALVDELEAVLNFGVGVETSLSPKFALYGTFATNKSAAASGASFLLESAPETYITTSDFDLLQVGGGASFSVWNADFALGLISEFGTQTIRRPINLPSPSQEELPAGQAETARISVLHLRLTFGFSLHF